MKHIGQTLKEFIESNGIVKRQVAQAIGISDNYLSMIFKKDTIDCELYEKLCQATGMDPSTIFEVEITNPTGTYHQLYSDIDNCLNLLKEKDLRIAEMERTINILMSLVPNCPGTPTEQND